MKKIYCDVCGEFAETPVKLLKIDLCEACATRITESMNGVIAEIKKEKGIEDTEPEE